MLLDKSTTEVEETELYCVAEQPSTSTRKFSRKLAIRIEQYEEPSTNNYPSRFSFVDGFSDSF